MQRFHARLIDFDDIKPAGAHFDECAGGIGIDSRGRVYFAAQDDRDPQDVAVFRYDTRNDTRQLLGTVRGFAAAAGNLGPNDHWPREETIAKVHVSFLEHDGRMYFATHNFADPQQDYRDVYDDLPKHRGAHLFAIDIETGAVEDITKDAEHGVAIANQSIAAMTIMPGRDRIVMYSFPCGDIVVHDLRSNETRTFPGDPELREDRSVNIAREIIATKQGRIFFACAQENFALRELDPATGDVRRSAMPNRLRSGYLSGMVTTRDGSTIYLVDLSGNLYRFDTGADRLHDLGNLLTDEDWKAGTRVTTVHGLTLSNDEKTLYTIPSRVNREHPIVRAGMRFLTKMSPGLKNVLARARMSVLEAKARNAGAARRASGSALDTANDARRPATNGGSKLYAFDIESGARSVVGRFPEIPMGAWVTGNGAVDGKGRIHLCYHTLRRNSVRLVQLTPEGATGGEHDDCASPRSRTHSAGTSSSRS